MLILAAVTLLVFLLFAIDAIAGGRSIRQLAALPAEGTEWPKVSMVIAARNEEDKIEGALRSVLALDYPALEVVMVEDRSTDGTAAILARMAENEPRLRVISIVELPPGWLGKNYALHRGAQEARGELLLFSDADVVFEPTVLRRAVRYFIEQSLDHLTAAPDIIVPSVRLAIFVAAFGLFFTMYARPWRARRASPRDHVGVGAFNLVRADLYRRCGGHEPIRMRPDDDMKLAKHLKIHGGRQDIVLGRDMMRVEWYSSIREAIGGLEKNSFSGVEYSLVLLVLATIFQLALCVWPFVALFLTSGLIRGINAATASLIVFLVAGMQMRSGNGRAWVALGFPLGALLFFGILWYASLKAVLRGGIRWRDTFYPLAELRANKV